MGFWACTRRSKDEVLFETVFPSAPMPRTLQKIACGIEKGLTGNGECVLVFRISQTELRSLVDQQGFVPESTSDADLWPMESCNDAIAIVARSDVKITPSFECYRAESKTKRVRIFYDAKRELAIVIARGDFGRRQGQPNPAAAVNAPRTAVESPQHELRRVTDQRCSA